MLGGSGWSGGRREVGRREREGLSVNCQEGRMREGERERGREGGRGAAVLGLIDDYR
jgi:hypothetical protein